MYDRSRIEFEDVVPNCQSITIDSTENLTFKNGDLRLRHYISHLHQPHFLRIFIQFLQKQFWEESLEEMPWWRYSIDKIFLEDAERGMN